MITPPPLITRFSGSPEVAYRYLMIAYRFLMIAYRSIYNRAETSTFGGSWGPHATRAFSFVAADPPSEVDPSVPAEGRCLRPSYVSGALDKGAHDEA